MEIPGELQPAVDFLQEFFGFDNYMRWLNLMQTLNMASSRELVGWLLDMAEWKVKRLKRCPGKQPCKTEWSYKKVEGEKQLQENELLHSSVETLYKHFDWKQVSQTAAVKRKNVEYVIVEETTEYQQRPLDLTVTTLSEALPNGEQDSRNDDAGCLTDYRDDLICIESPLTKRMICPICGATFDSAQDLDWHLTATHDCSLRNFCQVCNFPNESFARMHYHMRSQHPGVKIDESRMPKRSEAQKTALTGMQKRKLKCKTCRRSFYGNKALLDHMLLRTCKRYNMKQLAGMFETIRCKKSPLMYTQVVDNNSKIVYICDICEKQSNLMTVIHGHCRRKHGQRDKWQYRCRQCGVTTRWWRKHMDVHTRADRFKCDSCDTDFKTMDRMERHKRAVHAERYRCKLCQQSFSWIHNLARHSKFVHKRVLEPAVDCDRDIEDVPVHAETPEDSRLSQGDTSHQPLYSF